MDESEENQNDNEQYSLRSLLTLTTAVAVGSAILANGQLHPALSQAGLAIVAFCIARCILSLSLMVPAKFRVVVFFIGFGFYLFAIRNAFMLFLLGAGSLYRMVR